MMVGGDSFSLPARLNLQPSPFAEPSAQTNPRCYEHGLPAVCFGADLVNPRFRCPRCCRNKPQFGGVHGCEHYLNGHEAAEGVTV